MISDLMLYASTVALLISVAALALERVTAWRGLPRRGVWAAALVLSLAAPMLVVLMPRQARAPQAAGPAPSSISSAAPQSAPRADLHAAGSGAAGVVTSAPQPQRLAWAHPPSLERLLVILWATASIALASFYTVVGLRLRRAAQRWRQDRLNDHPVRVTEALGPAVYGLIHPVILIPQWVLDAPGRTRSLVLAHEQEHIAARDPALVLLGLVLIVMTPWNVPLWWQLRRLRFAIEVDCDARVLRRGEEATAYGEVLLTVGERRTAMPVGALALIEPTSQLLQRIRIMTAALPRRGAWASASAVALSLASLAAATQLQAPALRSGSITENTAVTELRKPPPGEDPRLAHVQDLVRATYPDLFNASAPSGAVLVTLLVHEDGTLYKSFKEDIAPTPWIPNSLYALDSMGAGCEPLGAAVRTRMPGWPAAQNHRRRPCEPCNAGALRCPGYPARAHRTDRYHASALRAPYRSARSGAAGDLRLAAPGG
jgi:beta-lactamase regulating signal transducer with metallopeptidase domain